MKESHLLVSEPIENKIFLIRNQKVMLDRDLASLYHVETKNLNRQVKRNIDRFPEEFMFPLNEAETKELVTNWHRFNSLKHSTSKPLAFTEHGVAMLSSVLRSKQAINMNILKIKTFIKLREIISTHKELAEKFKLLEMKVQKHDKEIHAVFEAIRQLLPSEPEKTKPPIGFQVKEKIQKYAK